MARSTPRRMVFCDGDVSQESIASWRTQILRHHAEAPGDTVTLVINSAGGSMAHALGFYSTIQDIIGLKVNTICSYVAGSAALLLFMLGGERLMSEQANLLLHDATVRLESGEALGAEDLAVMSAQVSTLNRRYAELIARSSAKQVTAQQVADWMKRKMMISAHDAVAAGLASGILKRQQLRTKRKPRTRKQAR